MSNEKSCTVKMRHYFNLIVLNENIKPQTQLPYKILFYSKLLIFAHELPFMNLYSTALLFPENFGRFIFLFTYIIHHQPSSILKGRGDRTYPLITSRFFDSEYGICINVFFFLYRKWQRNSIRLFTLLKAKIVRMLS